MKSAESFSKNWFRSFSEWGSGPIDRTLTTAIFVLAAAGMVMVYSASYIYAQERFHDGLFFIKRHGMHLVLGSLAFTLGYLVSLKRLEKSAYAILLTCTGLLVLTMLTSFAQKAGGASRWISILGLKFQPAELAKAGVVIFVAAQLSRKQGEPQNWRTGFLAYFVPAAPIYGLLLMQPDFGTTVLLLLTTALVLLATGIRIHYILTTMAVLVPAGAGLILSSSYRLARVQAFLDPWKDASGKGFQVIQSLVAVYSGRWFGVGLGNSKEKLFYLPEAHNDFIFAVAAEELGVFGIVFFVSLFFIIVTRGLRAAAAAHNLFNRGLALGIVVMIGLQAFFNMGVVMGLLPTKGLPLPLVSYGGTSLVINLFLFGILTKLSSASQES
jgi:cell division protein FtsW